MAALPHILSQYAEEAAFLWILRDVAVRAPHYSLNDLARLDGRIDAHLDGLLIGGGAAWEIVCGELRWEEPGEVFAAASLAFMSDDVARIQPVLEAVRTSIESSRGMISALGFLPIEQVSSRIKQLIASPMPEVRRIGIAASAIHRTDPGKPLVEAMASENDDLRSRALRAAGELGRRDLMPQLRAMLKDSHDESRLWAAWSLGLMGDKGASEILKEFVRLDFASHVPALELALRLIELPSANAWREKLAGNPETVRLAIVGAGVIGDPVAIAWLMQQVRDDKTARVAGESFSSITGLDLALNNLEKSPPEENEAGPTDNPEDEAVLMDPDENLPWPDPDLLTKWWSQNGSRFPAGRRLLLGNPLSADSLNQALRTGRQRQRATAAIELTLVSGQDATPLFEVRAHGKRQKRALGL